MAYPTLNQNKIYASLFNQIISIDTFADNIADNYGELVDAARVDGTLYGDTKVYLSVDCLASHDFDETDNNVLQRYLPPAPKTQTLTLDVFRQIALTETNFISKQAFNSEGSFSQFMSAILSMIQNTKRIYDKTTYSAYVGSAETNIGKQIVEIPLSDITQTGEEKNRLEAQMIAQYLADLFVNLKDCTRDYNDYGFLRAYSDDAIKVVFNSKYANKITKLDTPSLYHRDGLVDKMNQYILPSRFFGVVNADSKVADGTATRSLVEQDIGTSHYFAGDLITQGETAPAGTSYQEKGDIICKVLIKLPPYLSSMETSTSWMNAKNLETQHYLTWGRNSISYLKNYPMITVYAG